MADLKYEDVMAALRNADAAGDTEAATRLAQIASSLSATTQEPTTEAPSALESLKRGAGLAGRAVVTGLSSVPNTVLDFMSGAYNLGSMLTGSESRLPTMTQTQQQAMTNLGVPQPETTAEKALSGGLAAVSGGLGANLPLQGVKAAAPLMTATPAAFAATTAGGATAPVAFEAIKGVTGSDLAASIGSLGLSVVASGLAGKAAGTGAPKQPVVTMDEVKQRAQRAYTEVENSGIAVKPQSAQKMVNNIEADLMKADYLPELQPEVATVLNKFRQVIGTTKTSFKDLDNLRSLAGRLTQSSDANTRRLGSNLVASFDRNIADLGPADFPKGTIDSAQTLATLQAARKDWRNLSRASVLENALDVAAVKSAKPTASEAELIRDGFINLAKDKRKMAQFSKDEQAAILKVTKGIPLDAVLSQIARVNPLRGHVAGMGALGATAITQSPGYAVALAAAGITADKAQQMLRTAQGRKVISDIISGNVQPKAPSEMYRGLMTAPYQDLTQ